MSLSLTLTKIKKVEHYIRIMTHKLIVLRFLVENGFSTLYGWTHVSLMFVLRSEIPSLETQHIQI